MFQPSSSVILCLHTHSICASCKNASVSTHSERVYKESELYGDDSFGRIVPHNFSFRLELRLQLSVALLPIT